MKTAIAALLALGLAACAQAQEASAPPAPTPAASAESDCAARGGHLEHVGRARSTQCVIPYADGGQPCQDGSTCQSGRCVGPMDMSQRENVTGQCQRTNMAFGCYTRIEGGRVESAICVD